MKRRRVSALAGLTIAATLCVAPLGAHAANKDSTVTSLSCSPSPVIVGNVTICTAAVTDVGPAGTTPTGDVYFDADKQGYFNGGICALEAGSCSVEFRPARLGSYQMFADYGAGDSTHWFSDAYATLSATGPTMAYCQGFVEVNGGWGCEADFIANASTTVSGRLIPAAGYTGGLATSICDASSCTELQHGFFVNGAPVRKTPLSADVHAQVDAGRTYTLIVRPYPNQFIYCVGIIGYCDITAWPAAGYGSFAGAVDSISGSSGRGL